MFYASERIIKVLVGSRCCLWWGLSYAFRIAMQTLSEFFLSGMGCSCTEWNRRRVQAQMFLLSWPLPQLLHQSLLCSYLEDILTEKIWSIFLALFFLLHSALWKVFSYPIPSLLKGLIRSKHVSKVSRLSVSNLLYYKSSLYQHLSHQKDPKKERVAIEWTHRVLWLHKLSHSHYV